MPIATADQIRNRPILVTIPGTDLQIACRRPDPLALILADVLPLRIFGEVLQQISAVVRDEVDQPAPEPDTHTYYEFIDRWVTAAAVSPRCVLTEEEADGDPSVMWVKDLPREVRLEIIRATNRALASERLKIAVADFRRQSSVRAGSGSDGTPVRDEAVSAPVGA